MITMKTGSKTPVRFTFSDDVSETTITIAPDDDSAAIAAKLQRVLELEGVPTRMPVSLAPLAPGAPVFTAADRAATEQRMAQAQAGLNGWNKNVDIDTLPEA